MKILRLSLTCGDIDAVMATARIAFLSTSLKLKLPFLRKETDTFFFAFRLNDCHINLTFSITVLTSVKMTTVFCTFKMNSTCDVSCIIRGRWFLDNREYSTQNFTSTHYSEQGMRIGEGARLPPM